MPSVLWRCWLGRRKGIRPVKTERWGAGVVICLKRGAYGPLMPLPLTVSCFSKVQIGFTFLVPAHPGSPGQRAVKRVCVCIAVILWWACLLVCPLAYLTNHTSKLHDIIFACCVARCGVAVRYLLSVLLMTSCLLVTSQAQATQKGVCLNWLTKGSTGQRAEYVVYDCLVATTRVHPQTFSGLTPRIPGLFTDTFEHIRFYTFYFFFFSTFL